MHNWITSTIYYLGIVFTIVYNTNKVLDKVDNLKYCSVTHDYILVAKQDLDTYVK